MGLTELGASAGFTAGDLNTDGYFAAVAAYQRIWVCDGRPYNADIHLSGFHKLDMVNTSLVGTASGTFTENEIVTQAVSGATGQFVETVGSGATAKHLVYRTSTVEFDTTNVVTGAESSVTLTPSAVVAPPHWLNWTLSDGVFPDGGSSVMCLFEGRVWMNSMYHPNQWFATRQGNPLSLLEDDTDVQAAISSQTSEAGEVADSLIAFIRYKDNYLLFCLANSIYILRGGSTGSGAISSLTDETGIFSPDSYCWDSEGNLYLVGLTGFFQLPNGAATSNVSLDNISFRKLPNLFKTLSLNRQTDKVTMGFDRDNYLVNVAISMQDGAWSVCFAYDIRNDAILPDKFPVGKIPASFLYVNNYQSNVSGLLMGCYDGYVRKFDTSAKSDDGVTIDSFVLLGPITINELIRANIKVKEIQIVLSEDSDGLGWFLYQGKSSEEIVKGILDGTLSYTHSGTFNSGGRQASIDDKISGEAIAVLLRQNALDTSWGLEGVKMKFTISGREKDI